MIENDISFLSLSELESFDSRIFLGNRQTTQDVCNFILTLACIYNDYKDIIVALHYLNKIQPSLPVREIPAWGEFNGLKFHLIRSHISLVHELLNLIKHNSSVLKDQYFQSIINKLDELGKQTWEALTSASSKHDTTELSRIFLMIRNKVSFHYDPKEFFKGYRDWFLNNASKRKPYLSRGNMLQNERYYFAEASAQNYFNLLIDGIDQEQVYNLTTAVGPAISQIVKAFIDNRHLDQ